MGWLWGGYSVHGRARQRNEPHVMTDHSGGRTGNRACCANNANCLRWKSRDELYRRTAGGKILADLIPPVAEAFLKDQITIGHALLIAKLPASQQQEAFSAAFRGLWTSEGNSQVLIPFRELAAWIESNILLQLASAPFDKQDETLVPEAGSCVNCPKRTGFNKLLFPDVRKDSCKLCGIRFWGWGAGEGVSSPSPAQLFRSDVDGNHDAGCFILIGLCCRRFTCPASSSFGPFVGIAAPLWLSIHSAVHG
jgi:hypothetical protein